MSRAPSPPSPLSPPAPLRSMSRPPSTRPQHSDGSLDRDGDRERVHVRISHSNGRKRDEEDISISSASSASEHDGPADHDSPKAFKRLVVCCDGAYHATNLPRFSQLMMIHQAPGKTPTALSPNPATTSSLPRTSLVSLAPYAPPVPRASRRSPTTKPALEVRAAFPTRSSGEALVQASATMSARPMPSSPTTMSRATRSSCLASLAARSPLAASQD